MEKLTRQVWKTAIATVLGLALADSAYGQLPPTADTPVPSRPPVFAQPPLGTKTGSGTQTPTDPGLSSRPPAFTLAPDPKTPASTDPNAPAVTNDANAFAGFPSVQDAFSSLLPGNFKDTKYKWYGFVRLDGIYDFRPIGSTDDFVTSSIPVPQGKGQNAVLTPRYTRLGFDTATPVEGHDDWTIKTRIEMDFFNGNTSGLFGSFPIRLRFAWIDVGPFLVGQAASLFMDYDVFPNVLDYEGPGGMVLMRQPIAAVRLPLADNLKLSIGVEQPYSDIQWQEGGEFVVNPGTGIITEKGVAKNIQRVPDVTANLRYTGDYCHLQVAGILRHLTYQSADEHQLNETGYGVNLTGTFHPWAMMHGIPNSAEERGPWEKSRFLGQFACGRGINRYIQDVNGFGLDATFDTTNGFRAIPAYGWFLAYEQWWTDKLASNFTYGQNWSDLTNTLPDNTYKNADYVTANLIWLPIPRLGLGVEFMYGSRENKDGEKGKAYRVQTGVQYRF